MKQTAVEWLIAQLDNRNWNTDFYKSDIKRLINQSKEMEKKALEDSFLAGGKSGFNAARSNNYQTFDEYYNKAYGKKVTKK